MTLFEQFEKVEEFIQRGMEIGGKEYHPATNGFAISFVSGPLYNAWMDEINIFNDRYLKNHPMYNSINTTYLHHKNQNPSLHLFEIQEEAQADSRRRP